MTGVRVGTRLALLSGAFGVTGLALWVYAGVSAVASPIIAAGSATPALAHAERLPPLSSGAAPTLPAHVDTDAAARLAREQLIARVRDPSRGHEPWNEAGLALLRTIGTDAIATTDVGCYMAGCMATFAFASTAVYRDAVAKLESSSAYAAWTGGKQLTAPETRADDTVVIAVVFERPD